MSLVVYMYMYVCTLHVPCTCTCTCTMSCHVTYTRNKLGVRVYKSVYACIFAMQNMRTLALLSSVILKAWEGPGECVNKH